MTTVLIVLAFAQMSAAPVISALPDVRSITPANAAGVLQYCAKNQLVSSAVSDGVIGSLSDDKKITSSHDYTAGQAGHILSGGKTFALGQTTGFLRSQACDLVLRQAQQLQAKGMKP
jgi:hypothetical protein